MARTVDPDRHEAKRRHILAAAAACFTREGFERTTTAQICAEAGISTGGLFHYFPSKAAVFHGLFEQDRRDNEALLARAAEADDPWPAALQLVDSLAAPVADPLYSGLAVEAIGMAGRDERFAALVEANDAEVHTGFVELFTRAAQRGQVDPSIRPDTAASWTMAMIDSLYIRIGAEPGFDAAEELHVLRLVLTRFLRADSGSRPFRP